MDGAQTDKAASSPVEAQAEISGLLARGAAAEAQRVLDTALTSWPKNPKLLLLKGQVLAAASPAEAAVHYAALIAEPALAPWALARLADLFPVSGLAGEDAAAIAEAVCSDAVERRFKEPILDALLATGDAETVAKLTEIAGTRSAIFKYESRLAVARTEAGDFAGAMGAVGQHGIDVAGIGNQLFHLGSDRRELFDAEFDQRVLEAGKLSATEFAQHVLLAAACQCRVDPDQIVGLGARLQALFLRRQRLRVGLGLADLLRDGVGIVGEVDA